MHLTKIKRVAAHAAPSRLVIVGGSILALAAGGAGAAVAIGSGEDEAGATGPGADQAKAAALQLYPGGHANAVERDSENGATWEVEVAKPDGGTVDVRLDQNYKLVVAEADSEDQGGS